MLITVLQAVHFHWHSPLSITCNNEKNEKNQGFRGTEKVNLFIIGLSTYEQCFSLHDKPENAKKFGSKKMIKTVKKRLGGDYKKNHKSLKNITNSGLKTRNISLRKKVAKMCRN